MLVSFSFMCVPITSKIEYTGIVPQVHVKQVNMTGSVNRPLAWPVLEILFDSAVWELGMESGHLLLGFAGLPDTYKKMVDTVAACFRHFHG